LQIEIDISVTRKTFQADNTVSRNEFESDNLVSRNEFDGDVVTQFPGASQQGIFDDTFSIEFE